MPMPPNVADLMQHVGRLHDEVAKVHATLTSPKQREVLSEALEELRSAKAEVEQTFPEAHDLLKAKAEKVQRDTAQFQAEQPQREAQRKAALQQAKAAAAKRKAQKQSAVDSVNKPQKPKLPAVKLPADWGQQLGGELIERFGRPAPQDLPPAARAGEIWEDWQWDEEA